MLGRPKGSKVTSIFSLEIPKIQKMIDYFKRRDIDVYNEKEFKKYVEEDLK